MAINRILLYIGTYTRPAPYLKAANGQGIYVYSVDPATGQLTYLSETGGIDSPSYLAIDSTKRCLYATSEVWGWHEGMLSAYAINGDTGALTYINKQPTQGGLDVYVAIDKTSQYALAANYGDGQSLVMLPIRQDSSLNPVSSAVKHEGSGPTPHQDRPHTHCVVIDSTNTYALAAALGLDKIMVYRLDLAKGKLIPNIASSVSLPPGAGPRHIVFHPSGPFAYVINELNSTLSVLSFHRTNGSLAVLQTVSCLPEGYTGESYSADLHILPSGRFLYGSNRGHDSIVIFAVDQDTGRLSYVSHQSTKGHTPRNFAIDPTGAFLLVANQNSDSVVTFRINQDTGELEDTGYIAQVPTPVCLKMIVV